MTTRPGKFRIFTALALSAALLSFHEPMLDAQQPAPQAQTPPPAPPVTVPGGLNLNNASLLEVINILAQDLHISYILDSSVRNGSVTINTYGAVRATDVRPLLETILRMNNLAMVQVGDLYRIIPIANIGHQPINPVTTNDPSKLPDDERLVLNLIFLRYVTSAEMSKILQPFLGDGAQMTNYDPGNLLIVLDNSRNMRRTLELVNMFDSDAFAGQRVRSFETHNSRPTDLSQELESIFKAYALAGDKSGSPIRFLPLDRINTILVVSPNPESFKEVEKWIAKLDIPAKAPVGAVDNYVYKLHYQRAEVIGGVVRQLYGGPPVNFSNLYGGVPGNSSYPASNYPGASGFSGFGAQPGNYGGGGYGGYGNPYGASQPYGAGYGGGAGYAGGGYGAAFGSPYGTGGYAPQIAPAQTGAAGLAAPGTTGVSTPGTIATGTAAAAAADQTGTYLSGSPYGYGRFGPRIIPNPFDNTLLVQATPQEWEQIKNLIDKLDVPPRQVLIEAKIYEVDLTGDLQYGVESFLEKSNAALPSGIAGHQLTGSSNLGLNLSAGTLVGQSRQLLALLTASDVTTKAKVLSAPSIIATDSIPASITVGSSVPTISSESVTTGIDVSGTTPFTNTINNTSTGIGLNILARVNPSGVVTMVINQNVTAPIPNPLSSMGAAGSNIDSPSFSQRNVSTQVTVEDGDTIAIGGIIMDSITDTSQGIPILHRLPYIGAAFGTKSHSTTRTELIIFLTPRVIYDTTQMTDATEELREQVKGLKSMMEHDK